MKQRSSPWRGLFILSVAVLVLAIGYRWAKVPRSSSEGADAAKPPVEQSGGRAAAPAAKAAAEDSELHALTPSQLASVPQLPAVIQSTGRPASATAPPPARTEPTPYARQLVASLTRIDPTRGITKEEAEQWKQGLQALIGQGAAAAPAIREFLEQNQELNFGAVSGGDQLGQSSLRTALINALQQIGGPDAVAVMLQTLQTTTLPSEIALLAQNLEQQAPGQYRQETLSAVNEVLTMAAKGQLGNWDVGPLFQVLQNYGDTTTAAALEQLQTQWKYYGTISLADLQAGQGVSALIGQTQNVGSGSRRDLAFEMLAQVAAQYPDASTSLLEQARLNQIPDSAWPKIAAGLAGDQYQLGTPPSPDQPNGAPTPGLKTFHIEAGNQNFYSLPVTAVSSADQIAQRRALINQLLSVNSSPAASQALQGALASLPWGQ